MAFFKKRKLSDGKWHAIAANLQRPATIDDVADELAARSTVSRADTYAVLVELGDVLGQLMASGRSVKLKGVGTFYLTCQTKGQGHRHARGTDAGDDHGREGALHPRIQPRTPQANHGAHDAGQVAGVD